MFIIIITLIKCRGITELLPLALSDNFVRFFPNFIVLSFRLALFDSFVIGKFFFNYCLTYTTKIGTSMEKAECKNCEVLAKENSVSFIDKLSQNV